MENNTIYRFMNHDSSHAKPKFEKFTLTELNERFETNYTTVDEATDADPEYLFDEEQMNDFLISK